MTDKEPVIIACEGCGERIIRSCPSQRFCPDCARKRHKANQKRYKMLDKTLYTEPAAPQTVPSKVPPEMEGWSTKGKSLALVDAEAKEFGMSYGQYMAAIQGGTIERILTARGMTPTEWKAKLRTAKKKVGKKK